MNTCVIGWLVFLFLLSWNTAFAHQGVRVGPDGEFSEQTRSR